MLLSLPTVAVLTALIVTLSVFILEPNRRRANTLPPGPPRRFLIGNLLDMPRAYPWKTFQEWCNLYGKPYVISCSRAYSQISYRRRGFPRYTHQTSVGNWVDQSSKGSPGWEIAHLFRQSSFSYARTVSEIQLLLPSLVVTCQRSLSWGWSLPSMTYGPTWRTTRRLFRENFSGSKIQSYKPIQVQEARHLLHRIMVDPASARQHIRWYVRATIESSVTCLTQHAVTTVSLDTP